MDELEKLLRKASVKDRKKILSILKQLKAGDTKGLNYQKLKGLNLYRIRAGNYRIIFSFTKTKAIRVETIRLRNEGTYK